MAKVKSRQQGEQLPVPRKISQPSCVEREAEGISCILCYLVKEGVKKAYDGIRGLKADKANLR